MGFTVSDRVRCRLAGNERRDDSGEDVKNDLLIHGVAFGEDCVSAYETRKQGIVLALFTTVKAFLEDKQRFVYGYEFSEVCTVLLCGFVDGL